ncbi:MAG TPA: Ig-like domain-containing protein [Solirubrobacteraceae bacterium]|nr:Ig-like domain-containing protein [Solirubrobacteraceae bacterium]
MLLYSPRRVAKLIGAFSLLALASPVASASAIEPATSQITSPAGPTYALNDESESSPPSAFKVEGTTNVEGKVSLRCYFGTDATSKSYSTLANEVTPNSEKKFFAEVEAKLLHNGPCVLRAVPFDNVEAHPPGSASEEAADPFKGPRIIGSSFRLFNQNGVNYDYQFQSSTPVGYFNIESVGDCGLDESYLYAPETLSVSNSLFFCDAALFAENEPPSGPSTRSELQIDGANAYSPAAAREVNRAIEEELESKKEPLIPVAGAPQVMVEKSFDHSTGLVTIKEVDPIVKCAPSTAFPPTATSCKSFVSTGVELDREWQTGDADQVASLTDNWRSIDGVDHALNALYDQDNVNGGGKGGAYELPGTNVFSATTRGQTISLPAGLGRIYYKEDAETPAVGDGEHPQGAIVYDTPPSGPISVYRGTGEKFENGFEMPYQGTIPAGGSYTLHMAFIQAYKLSEVEALASEVLAGYPPSAPPTLSIASPANGTTVSSPSVTVAGTVTDKRVITSFTVDGKAVAVGAEGAWSTSVALNKGANTITALATDQAGFSTEKSVSVTYTSPPPPVAHVSQVGAAKGKNGEVTFALTCKGTAGTACEVESTLTTVEKTRHGKPVAVSARRRPRTRSEEVTVGSSKLTIPAGQKVTISIQLNSTGKSLLAKFGALPVHLSVVQASAGHRSTVIAQNLTVTPHRRPRRHHHHRHHHH